MEWILVAAQAETRFGSNIDGLLTTCRFLLVDPLDLLFWFLQVQL